MIVWINGASGSGKTQAAFELRRRASACRVVDPEPVGFALQRMVPPSQGRAFQGLRAWRHAVITQLDDLDRRLGPTIVVPQTLLETDHHAEIMDGLRGLGHDVCHVTLSAAPPTLASRLRSRGQGPRSWAFEQIDRSVEILQGAEFAEHVITDDRSVDEVVEAVAAHADLELVRGRDRPTRGSARRALVQLRHIRLRG